MRWMKRLLITSALIVIAVAPLAWIAAKNLYASFGYVVEARFSEMPTNDNSLVEWIRSQPGVVRHTVHIGRFESNLLYVTFIQSQNLLGEPPFPNLDAGAKSLGYRGADGPFRDSKDRSRPISPSSPPPPPN